MADGLWIPAAGVLAAIIVALALVFWWKGQPFTDGDIFRASRWSRGNRWFPTQVLITPTSVVHYTPELFGRKEQSIHIVHVASVSIDTNLLFSNVIIETSGGATPVTCHGHRKRDAIRMKHLIEQYQTQIYRSPANSQTSAATGGGGRLGTARG